MSRRIKLSTRLKKYWTILGPGLVTGASDDDPSGIATYSQAGARFGYATLWTAWITFPLMATIQEMCARIGIVTSMGLTKIVKKHYHKSILYLMMLFSFPAITLNIGADIHAMGAVSNLLFPQLPSFAYSIIITILLMIIIIRFSYTKIAAVLKWLCLSLLLYLIVPLLINTDWTEVLKKTFIPTVRFNNEFFEILVAILGTTISPYLFFWQASMEVEHLNHGGKRIVVNKQILSDMKTDVTSGMLFSNVVMFFIILTTATVLNKSGITEISTVAEAANALKPAAGEFAYLFFALGVIGTGLLTIPVLAGSLSYIIAETFSFKKGLDKKFNQAREFYLTIIVSLILGLSLDFIGISPIQALIYTAILYGLTAPVLIFMILHICNNKKIMGKYTNKKWSNILGYTTLFLMTLSIIALVYFQISKP